MQKIMYSKILVSIFTLQIVWKRFKRVRKNFKALKNNKTDLFHTVNMILYLNMFILPNAIVEVL